MFDVCVCVCVQVTLLNGMGVTGRILGKVYIVSLLSYAAL